MRKKLVAKFLSLILFLLPGKSLWASPIPDETSLGWLIKYGLEHGPNDAISGVEIKTQESLKGASSLKRSLPQIELSGSYQQHSYSRLFDTPSGPISNNGKNQIVALTITYDLQKLLDPERALSERSVELAKIDQALTRRSTVRSIKQIYYTIRAIEKEIAELKTLIGLFAKIDSVLQRQKARGLYIPIERRQFEIQQGLLDTELQNRNTDLNQAYLKLSNITGLDDGSLKAKLQNIVHDLPLSYANIDAKRIESINSIQDKDLIESLGKDYSLSQLEYEHFNRIPMPSLFARGLRQWPTMPSADGPEDLFEVGFTFPLDSLMSRRKTKSVLEAKMQKGHLQFEKNMLEYRNEIRLQLTNLLRYQQQSKSIVEIKQQTDGLLKNAFLYFAQKRIDAMGTLDIFQKHLQATHALLNNELQIKSADAELEYLLGGTKL